MEGEASAGQVPLQVTRHPGDWHAARHLLLASRPQLQLLQQLLLMPLPPLPLLPLQTGSAMGPHLYPGVSRTLCVAAAW